ncbi:aminotransferase class I/II-fold pyridoxal phosphate-dependent enzyme [candidate division GN15 bacterium]|nr:aminotransferase class I/II-fold pyridoxal phosphate-dependent enzyme [candidate division GN15 bacterium]
MAVPQENSPAIRHKLAQPYFDDAEFTAVREVLASGRLIQGLRVEAFEGEVCRLTGAREAVAVSSGTAALHVAFSAYGLTSGDAVFIPSFAWPSAANVARVMGALPVLIDVHAHTYNIDPDHLRQRIAATRKIGWAKPRLVVPVHQFGLPCDMEAVLQIAADERLDVIEDAACAMGAKVGNTSAGLLGVAGIFSFHPRKSVTTGEGGAIVTNDSNLAARCRAFRNHGQRGAFDFAVPGLNYRLSELHAAIGLVQIHKLAPVLEKRRQLVGRYLHALEDVPGVVLPEAPENHTWQTFMVRVNGGSRDEIIRRLRQQHGVEAGIGSVDAHLLAVHREGPEWVELPVSLALHEGGLALPLHAGMMVEDAGECAEALQAVMVTLNHK